MSFLSRVKYFLKHLNNFIFPKSAKLLVLEAMPTRELIETLPRAHGPEEENVIALFDYSHPLVKEIIWEVKYAGNSILASKMGEILYDTIMEELQDKNVLAKFHSVLLMPLPISGKRRFERGWNQAELLAKAIKSCDQSHNFKYMPGQLVKIIHTESQTRAANKRERRENLTNSMQVINPESVAEKYVVLVDDVTTTGSTFAEARRALKAAGVKKILCIAVAH